MRTATCKVIELVENGVLSWETVASACLQYMSEDDVADMANSCNWLNLKIISDQSEDSLL